MTMFGDIRDRVFPRDASDESRPAATAKEDPVAEAGLPFAGYHRLDDKDVIAGLSEHSQAELVAVETYERSHQDRRSVLDKLRYLRGSEPLPGYDALSITEIVTALNDADVRTIKAVRDYERKFAKRRDVLEGAARLQRERRAVQPASVAPAYQPMSASR